MVVKHCKVCLAILVLLNLSFCQELAARGVQGHLVSPEELDKLLIAQSSHRLLDIREIQTLLRHESVTSQKP